MKASKALKLIRQCVDEDCVIITTHFAERMRERALFWGDVLAILESPKRLTPDGQDAWNRHRWLISADISTTDEVELLCVLDGQEPETVFVTIYWL